jgi:adenine-specific DNA glycosylase
LAYEQGKAGELPWPKKVKKWVNLELVFLVHRVGARVLLAKREGGWNPGMYEPPCVALGQQAPAEVAEALLAQTSHLSPGRTPTAQAQAAGKDFTKNRLDGNGSQLIDHGVVRHTITHHRIRAHVFSSLECPELGERPLLDPQSVPLTGLARKVLHRAFV